MELKDIQLLKLQTKMMQDDKTVQGFCVALDRQLKNLADRTKEAQIYTRIQELRGQVLDILAWQFNTDFYDSSLPIQQRRALVNNSLITKRTKGTPASVESLVQTIFGDGIVEEWFEYGGEPYHFRVKTTNPSATNEQAQEFIRAVESVKRLSTVLDQVILLMTDEMHLYVGCVLHMGDNLIVRQVV